MKSVGPNSSSKCQLYCGKQPNPMMSSCSAALRWLVPCFKSSNLSRIATFSFHVKLVRFIGAILHEWNTQSLMFANRCGCGCQGKSLSSSHTCNEGNLCGSPRANVPSRTSQSGQYNRRAGWYIQRVLLCTNSVPAENGRYKWLDDISVDDITGFYCSVVKRV